MAAIDASHKLQWSQRVALVRHNLHSARRTGDFTFFKALQAHALIDGTDHVAILQSILGNDADSLVSTLDNLNAGIAYVHQDAFKAVYDSAKSTMYKVGNTSSSRKSLLRVDISQQRDMADHAIDKTANSAINLIEEQPIHCQDAVANAWITGMTIISDAVCVCLKEMELIEEVMDDYIRLEYSWNTIQSSVDAAVSALRGIFNLMATPSGQNSTRNLSISSETPPVPRGRTSSTSSALSLIKRAFSHSHGMGPTPQKSNNQSLPSNLSTPRNLRMSISAACPTRMPNFADFQHTHLDTIPPTPAVVQTSIDPANGSTISPFKEKDDYFAFNLEGRSSDVANKPDEPNDELMHVESLDPLYTPNLLDQREMAPLTLRRLSEVFGITTPSPIAAG